MQLLRQEQLRRDKHADRVFKTFLEWNNAVGAEEANSMRMESGLIYGD